MATDKPKEMGTRHDYEKKEEQGLTNSQQLIFIYSQVKTEIHLVANG